MRLNHSCLGVNAGSVWAAYEAVTRVAGLLGGGLKPLGLVERRGSSGRDALVDDLAEARLPPKRSVGYRDAMSEKTKSQASSASARKVTKSASGGGTARSATSGRFVSSAAAAKHPRPVDRTAQPQGKRIDGVPPVDAIPDPTPGTPSAVPTPAGDAQRPALALDPLAPERTRWLADTVGGGGKLAAMLGVHPSQTSRWATGQEHPGARVAPLLIDLEHVLARVRLVWAEPAATTWMTSANAHLDGSRPVDVLAMRGVGPVLDALDAGAWGGAA